MEKIGIIGAGKLGLCLALNIASNNNKVLICEQSLDRVNSIKSKKIDTIEPGVNDLLSEISFDYYELEEFLNLCSIAFITVRTEGNPDGSYDCKQVHKLFNSIANLKPKSSFEDKILIVNCNVNPGTVESCQKKVEHLGLIVAYSPEWVAQGSILKDQTNPDVLVIGHSNPIVQERILSVYNIFLKNEPSIHKLSPKSAEITKILLNTYLTLKITFANYAGDLLIRSGEDPSAVLNTIGSDTRIGNKYFSYGFGYGGPCFPRDIDALISYSESLDMDNNIFKSVKKYNLDHREEYINYLIKNAIDETIEIECISYKPGIDLFDFSEQLETVIKLAERGFKIKLQKITEGQIKYLKENYSFLLKSLII